MLEVSIVLNQNEVEMVCSFLERAVLFEEDGEDTPEFKTNFRLLVRKFAFARSFMKAKAKTTKKKARGFPQQPPNMEVIM